MIPHFHISLLLIAAPWLCACSESEEEEITEPAAHPLAGRHLFTLFDSFGSTGVWQSELAELSQCLFDQELNNNQTAPISYGGTSTLDDSWCGQRRAINLVRLAAEHRVDVLMMENVNDIHAINNPDAAKGDVTDRPWMLSQEVTIDAPQLIGREQADDYWKQHFAEIVESVANPQCGTRLQLPYEMTHAGYRITLLNKPTDDGTLTINVGSNKFGITIRQGMTQSEVIDRIVEYNYGPGWTDVRTSGQSVVLSFYTDTDMTVRVDAGSTGLEIDISPSPAYATLDLYYAADDTTRWTEASAWVSWLSLYSQYKGLFGYLREQLPDCQLYLFIPTYYYGLSDQYTFQYDGNVDSAAYEQLPWVRKARTLFDVQRQVAALFDVPVLDMNGNCDIGLHSLQTYYNPGDIHPNEQGYAQWAETVFKLTDNR